MFVKIPPKGSVHPHKDNGIKRHYVLKTNELSIIILDGEEYHLEERGIYDLDSSLEHSAVNFGDTERIHRIIG